MPAPVVTSATPATSGASGPMTTRSASSLVARATTSSGSVGRTLCSSASPAMPGLPGAACNCVTLLSRASDRVSACSLPPDPTTSTRTSQHLAQLNRLIAARSDAHRAHWRADHALNRTHVRLCIGRQIGEILSSRDVLPPPVQVLINRGGVMEVGLRHRDLVVALAVHLVGHAHGHLLQAGEYVELSNEVVGQAVDSRG